MSDGRPDAGEAGAETLATRVASLLPALEGTLATMSGPGTELTVGGRLFAVVAETAVEVSLDPAVARAALATPDTQPSERGGGWINFAPATADRFALDRAEAWLRSAHRRAGAVRGGH